MKPVEMVRNNEHRIAVNEDQVKVYNAKGFKPLGEKAPVNEIKTENVTLDDMSLQELKEEAKKRGITGYSALKKEDLIQILKGDADDNDDESGKGDADDNDDESGKTEAED